MPSAADRSITPIEQSYTAKKRTAQSRFRIGSLASYTGQKKDLRGTVKVVSYEKQGGIVIEVDGVTATVSPFALVALGTASPRAEPTSRRSTRSSVPKATATPARIFRNGVVVGSNPPAPAPVADLVLVPIAPAVLLLAAPRIPLTTAASRIGRFGLWLLAWRGTVPRPERRALVRTMDVLPALDALAPEPAPVKQAVYPTLLYTIAVRDAGGAPRCRRAHHRAAARGRRERYPDDGHPGDVAEVAVGCLHQEARHRGGGAVKRRPAVRKKVEVVPAPILGPSVRGQAPTLPQADPLPDDLRELLPPLDQAVRARVVDALADIALGELAGGSTDDVAKG
jgi:hypothetical protein